MVFLLNNQEKQPPQQQNATKMQHSTSMMQSGITNNTNIITPEFITLVAQAVQNIQPSNICKHKCSVPSTTDHPEYGSQMEQSFNSNTMTPNEW